MMLRVYYTATSDRQPVSGRMIIDASSRCDASDTATALLAEQGVTVTRTYVVREQVAR